MTVKAFSLENKERYNNVVLVKRINFNLLFHKAAKIGRPGSSEVTM